MKAARIVQGSGPRTAKIIIVGESPGYHEDKVGLPFQGPAGAVLTEELHRAGILRQSCYITNVIKEKPHGGKIAPFVDLSKKFPPTSEDYRKYVQYLKDEIVDIHPNVVVAVGAVALWALCGKKGITNYRGSILESTLVPGLKVVPIIHPSAALRKVPWKHLIAFDLRTVKNQSEFPWFAYDKREYFLEPSFNECLEYLNMCKQSKFFAFDIEVYGREVSCISFSYDKGHAISIPFIESKGDYFNPDQEAELWLAIADVLEDKETHVVGQNTPAAVTH